MEEQAPSTTEQSIENEDTKTAKKEKEREEILQRLSSHNLQNTRDKVAFILNTNLQARNSDKVLVWEYWTHYNEDVIKGGVLSFENFLKATSIKSISRIRAKIQNEYKLFEADESVKRHRAILQEGFSLDAIEDRPEGTGTYAVYIDETGKTQDYLAVGSLWLLDVGFSMVDSRMKLEAWIKSQEIGYEFHFKDLKNQTRLPQYKSFFQKFLSLYPAVSFKYIVVRNTGFANTNAAITDLTYHVLSKGIQHENETGRAPLPRYLQVWIDKDEDGSDSLKIENVRERLKAQNIEGLYLSNFEAVSSENNYLIQVIDLYTGAINRKLNTPNGNNIKDEMADFILDTLGFDVSKINKENADIDHSVLFHLK